MVTILRKSLTACEQFSALPPTPRKNKPIRSMQHDGDELAVVDAQCSLRNPTED